MTKLKPESRGWRGRPVGARPRRAGPERPGRRGFRDLRTSWGTDLLKWDMVDTIIKNTKKWHKKTETTRKAGQEKPGGRPANHQNPLNYLHKSQHLNSDRDQSSSTFIPQRSRVTLPAVRPLVGPAQIFDTNFAQIFDHIFYQNFILV